MAEYLVRMDAVSRIYGRGESAVAALDEVSFDVAPGDRIAVIGPSGSGKSTLLHLLAGLDAPTSGRIEWPGLGPPERLRPGPVGFAFQGPSLLPPLTVKENVALPLLLIDRDEKEADVEAVRLLDALRLTEVSDKLPEELSGGQLQRAGLARALVGYPRLVLADEPTGQQDRETGRLVVDVLLQEAGRSEAAVVVATHDRSVADRLAQQRELVNGRVVGEEVAPSSS